MTKKNVKKITTIKTKNNRKPTPAKKVVAKKNVKKTIVKKVAPKKRVIVKKIIPKGKAKPIVPKKKIAIIKKAVATIKNKIAIPVKKVIQKNIAKKRNSIKSNIPIKPELSKKDKLELVVKNIRKSNILNPIKVKAKGSIKYNPQNVRSILTKNTDKKIQLRYSDEELKVFTEIILKKLEISKNELFYLQNILSQKNNPDGSNNSNDDYNVDNEFSVDKEQFSQMARRQQQFIDHLEKALIRIKNKTYGICRVTGNLIDKDRLKAVPHATLSIEAKLMSMHNQNGGSIE